MANWIIRQNDNDMGQEQFGVPASVIQIIKSRGIDDDGIEDYLSDYPKRTYDPFLIGDMKAGCEKILSFAKAGKRICVYGDYDADGVTSTALLYSVIKKITDNVTYYIPSRFVDGYGLNIEAVNKIKNDNTDLLITVDCGSTSCDEVDYVKSLGMEIIISDHHRLREDRQPNCLFINTKKDDDHYPFKSLSGCGIAFKISQGLRLLLEEECDFRISRDFINSQLDLVAISTVADVVPLLDENRTMVKYGLDRINRRTRKGLNYLLDRLGISDRIIDSSSIAYILAPNLNALGRMGSAALAVELLAACDDDETLKRLADETVKTNQKRKNVQEDTTRICEEALRNQNCGDYAPVIFASGAHEGVAGIVAGSLKEKFHKPVCIVTEAEDGSLKGTGRSVANVNLHSLLSECSEMFLRFGGHKGACGFSLKAEYLDAFREKMQTMVKSQMEENPDLLEEKIFIEKILSPEEKNMNFVRYIKRLEPFGEANPVPLFCIKNACVSNFFTMGEEAQHFRFTATSSDGISVGCVLFSKAFDYMDIMYNGSLIDVVGELEINEYRGDKKLQLRVRDIRESI